MIKDFEIVKNKFEFYFFDFIRYYLYYFTHIQYQIITNLFFNKMHSNIYH